MVGNIFSAALGAVEGSAEDVALLVELSYPAVDDPDAHVEPVDEMVERHRGRARHFFSEAISRATSMISRATSITCSSVHVSTGSASHPQPRNSPDSVYCGPTRPQLRRISRVSATFLAFASFWPTFMSSLLRRPVFARPLQRSPSPHVSLLGDVAQPSEQPCSLVSVVRPQVRFQGFGFFGADPAAGLLAQPELHGATLARGHSRITLSSHRAGSPYTFI